MLFLLCCFIFPWVCTCFFFVLDYLCFYLPGENSYSSNISSDVSYLWNLPCPSQAHWINLSFVQQMPFSCFMSHHSAWQISLLLLIFLCSTYYWHKLKTYLHSSASTIRVWPRNMRVFFPTLSPVLLTYTLPTKQRLGFHRPKTMMYYEMWGRLSLIVYFKNIKRKETQ